MGGITDWVDSSVLSEIDTTFSSTFVQNEKGSNLQLKRLPFQGPVGAQQYLWTKDVSNPLELQDYAVCLFSPRSPEFYWWTLRDKCQIFYIRQKHSYARLYITRETFDELIKAYSVFTRIWDFLLPFSFKTQESDLGNAPFRFRQLETTKSSELGSFGI